LRFEGLLEVVANAGDVAAAGHLTFKDGREQLVGLSAASWGCRFSPLEIPIRLSLAGQPSA